MLVKFDSVPCIWQKKFHIESVKWNQRINTLCFVFQVLKAWTENGNTRSLIALDLESSDNLSDEALRRFLTRHGHQLYGLALSGMPHVTDQLWMAVLPILTNAR